MIRIYPALVLKSTLLEEYYLTGQYTPLSLEEAIEWCTGILPLYREAKIKVLRMGLQDSDTLESSVVAGPYHPAFGELVESRILYKRITKWLDMHLNNQKRIIIRTRPRLLSKLVGQKRTNIKGIKEKYQLHDVVVKTDLEDGEFVIEVE
jgi:histone acetyltransferase (RNA polymerase elongator complex component)